MLEGATFNGHPCFGRVDLERPKASQLARWLRIAGFSPGKARELAARYHGDRYRPRGGQVGYMPDNRIYVWKYYIGDVRHFRICWWQDYPTEGPR
jgi:hypothetical protein